MFSLFSKLTGRSSTPAREPEPAPVETASPVPAAAEPQPSAQPPAPASSFNIEALIAPPAAPPQEEFGPVDPERTDALKPAIVEAISTVFDPEIPVNIYELGLIYDIEADAQSRVRIRMTLTSPACPSAQQLPSEVKYKVKAVEGVSDSIVEVVWDPPWSKDMMSETAKLSLGIF
ncbi:MAG TPA: DUF59 domain-containing protein [Vicinamibacterales bacterium]